MSEKQEVRQIVANYLLCKSQAHLICFSNGEINRGNPFYVYYRDFELAYYSLNQKERFYFDNELLNNSRRDWWTTFYSSDEYLSIRKTALRNFLKKFYEIH